MPKVIIQRIFDLKVPEVVPYEKWTDEQRADAQEAIREKREVFPPMEIPTFNFAEQIYRIAIFVPDKDTITAMEQTARIGNLVVALNPNMDRDFSIFPDGTPIYFTDNEYKELMRKLGKFNFPQHPAWVLLVNALKDAPTASLDELHAARESEHESSLATAKGGRRNGS